MKSEDRLRISQSDASLNIEIIPYRDSFKSNLLFAWLLVWTLCGIIVFSQFFSNMSKEEKLLMAVWMAFWAYFEYKIGNAYLWRKNGKEQISFDQNNIEYKRIIGKKITAKSFVIDNISDITIYEFGKNNFSDSFQNSYWVIGNETVFITNFDVKSGFGLQLTKEDATRLLQAIKKFIKRKKLA